MTSRRRTRFSDRLARAWLPLALLAAALATCGPAAAADPTGRRLVVVLYPEDTDGSPGAVATDRAIRSTFIAEAPVFVEVRNEYVETAAAVDAEIERRQLSYLRQKYAGRKVDLVIAVLTSALDFALAHRAELFPGAPVVHCAVDRSDLRPRHLPADVIGVPIRADHAATLETALRLQPDTRSVFVVAGNAPFDLARVPEVRQAFAPYAGRVEITYLVGLPFDDLLARVSDLPPGSIIYYLHIFRDGTGKTFVPAEALDRIAARANAPIYGRVSTHVGRGIVGGRVFSFDAEGRAAARLSLRVLTGERPEAITVPEAAENIDMFDWRQLKRWGLDERDLPPGSAVLFRDVSLWESYRWYVVGGISLCAVQALLIAGLLIHRARRRRSEFALRESEARFRLMADAAPVLIWTAGMDKRCTYVNRPWLEFTGRTLEQELGEGWADGIHPDDRRQSLAVYASQFDKREPFEMEYRLRRHDGEFRWVVDQGVPRFTPDGEFAGYIGACTDLTERRRAEEGLRASQRELRLLTGQLIEAQEGERRRVARELHDDLGQSLALLSVDLDLVARRPPATPTELAERLRAVSARVRELSSAVHDLSHQLHPSKLEHLGLDAALRGLCTEVGEHHRLKVKFAAAGVPRAIPEATSVCVYRIAQEALRNVVKHGRTDRARVELTGAAGRLRLRISDHGAGFDPAARGDGLGLVSMRERLALVGGRIAIDSRPGGGTRIEVCVPLPEPDAAPDTPVTPCGDDLVAAGATAEESP
jgi:PAS domain S-box-containing protein